MNGYAFGTVTPRVSIVYVILVSYSFFRALADGGHFLTDYLQSELQRAEEHVASQPNDSYAYVSRGISLSLVGRQGEAIADFLKAIELDPKSAAAYGSRADVLFNMGLLDSARRDVDRSLELDSDDSGSYVLRGRIWLEWGKPEKALADFNKATEMEDPGGPKYRALVRMREGKFEEALDDLSKAIDWYKVDDETYCWRAISYRKLGKIEDAEQDEARFKELFARLSPTLQSLSDTTPLTSRNMQINPMFPLENPVNEASLRSVGAEGVYIDIGACPFEGCNYGIWTARQDVDAYEQPRNGSPVSFRVPKGASSFADTGFVATLKVGQAVAKKPVKIGTRTVAKGEYFDVLHYAGEGFGTVRYQDEIDKVEIDGMQADMVVKEESVWWVRCWNSDGAVGWLKDPEGFDGYDALG